MELRIRLHQASNHDLLTLAHYGLSRTESNVSALTQLIIKMIIIMVITSQMHKANTFLKYVCMIIGSSGINYTLIHHRFHVCTLLFAFYYNLS